MENMKKPTILFGKGDLEGHRFHIRHEVDGGTLVIDASRLLFLNETALDYALAAIQAENEDQVISKIQQKYAVSANVIKKDYRQLRDKILSFIKEPDIDPIETFDFDEAAPFSHTPTAPYRVDLALTYRCNNHCPHCYVEVDRRNWDSSKELSTEEWKKILDRLIEIGVPHVSFTGGEPTLRRDLVELVRYSEDIGIIAGLITNGRLLTKQLVEDLVDAGIDYVQITLESHLPEIHDKMVGIQGAWKETVQGLDNFIPTDVYTITNTTLTKINLSSINGLVGFLAAKGQTTFAMNGLIYSGSGKDIANEYAIAEEDLGEILSEILMEATEHEMRLIWYTPTQYCSFNPEEFGLGPKRCTAAFTSMAIEPNGAVIPCQSYFSPLGNLLRDPWETIWNHDLAKHLRSHAFIEDKCNNCEYLEKCGGGCPLYSAYGHVFCHPGHRG
ncbi:MAG: radical SAM protein [Candidatus Ranarchaeia archaeon]